MPQDGPGTEVSSAALALRESFGDRKLPDITRKITACVACRKRKVKCEMRESGPPCTRCKARALPCTVNRSIQMLLENDASWKDSIEQRLRRLEDLLAPQDSVDSTDDVAATSSDGRRPILHEAMAPKVRRPQFPQDQRPSDYSLTSADTLNFSCSLGAFPASSMNLSATTVVRASASPSNDFVSQGILGETAAEEHFKFFQENMSHYIYDVISSQDTLTSVRAKSSLLTAAVCTTAALCQGSSNFEALFGLLKQEVSAKTFSSSWTFDDIRALCIGSFWLNDISAALNALGKLLEVISSMDDGLTSAKAVRIAAELNLHRCITKIPFVIDECCDRTRLYYLVFVCDHQCSSSYGRPPMTRDFSSLKNARSFLQSQFSTAVDLKLISQVELWSIGTQVFEMYGADIENPSIQSTSDAIAHFSSKYDGWRDEWLQVMSLMLSRQLVSHALVDLYYQASKLQLFSHIFRGSSQRDRTPPINAHGLDYFAQQATDSALSIIAAVMNLTDPGGWFTQLPTYLVTMLAFACVFLFRISSQRQYQIYHESSIQSLQRLHNLLQSSPATIHSSHPLSKIKKSLAMAMEHTSSQADTQDGRAEGNLPCINDFNWDSELFDISLFEADEHWLTSHSQSGPIVLPT